MKKKSHAERLMLQAGVKHSKLSTLSVKPTIVKDTVVLLHNSNANPNPN